VSNRTRILRHRPRQGPHRPGHQHAERGLHRARDLSAQERRAGREFFRELVENEEAGLLLIACGHLSGREEGTSGAARAWAPSLKLTVCMCFLDERFSTLLPRAKL